MSVGNEVYRLDPPGGTAPPWGCPLRGCNLERGKDRGKLKKPCPLLILRYDNQQLSRYVYPYTSLLSYL